LISDFEDGNCTHFEMINDVTPSSADQCLQCVEMDDEWVHLRLCMICGQVGCCDNSKNTHATKHFHSDGHGIIKSHQPGEEWYWCYMDEVLFTIE
jgi:uncharacterized UBP type Zn finger protein